MTENIYPWYDIVDGNTPLQQGDFIKNCPIVLAPPKMAVSEKVDIVEADVQPYDVIIMSQSCDILEEKIDLVLVCPYYPMSIVAANNDFFKSKEGKESLRRGNNPGYHLLNKPTIGNFEADLLVVDYRSVFSVPLTFIIQLAKTRGNRLRLLPPYREHLSQAFARFFMRVGLPVDIPPFK